jgi:hypothetical protein
VTLNTQLFDNIKVTSADRISEDHAGPEDVSDIRNYREPNELGFLEHCKVHELHAM